MYFMLCDWGCVVENASLQRTKIIESAEYGRFQITICADQKLAKLSLCEIIKRAWCFQKIKETSDIHFHRVNIVKIMFNTKITLN